MSNLYMELVEGKSFYEIEKPKDGEGIVFLYGPLEGIYPVVPKVTSGEVESEYSGYDFIQVINGAPVAAFKKSELLILDKSL